MVERGAGPACGGGDRRRLLLLSPPLLCTCVPTQKEEALVVAYCTIGYRSSQVLLADVGCTAMSCTAPMTVVSDGHRLSQPPQPPPQPLWLPHCTPHAVQLIQQLQQEGFRGRNLAGSAVAWAQAGQPLVDPATCQPVKRLHTFSQAWSLQPDDVEAVVFPRPFLHYGWRTLQSAVQKYLPTWLRGGGS